MMSLVDINPANRIELKETLLGKDRVKNIPGARWDKNSRRWTLPLSWSSCKVLSTLYGDRLKVGPALRYWIAHEEQFRVNPALSLRTELTGKQVGHLCTEGLYDFQQAGAEFLVVAKQAILGDVVGSGKTIQTIAAARDAGATPALVVCPTSLRITWKREIERWWPGATVFVIDGPACKRSNTFRQIELTLTAQPHTPIWVIIGWEAVRLHSRLARFGAMALLNEEKTPKELNKIPWKLVVADEAHRLSHPQSKQTRAVWAIGDAKSVEYRWALTGTPLTNAPDTLWPILRFLNKEEWPSKRAFIERYTDHSFNPWGGLEVTGLKKETTKEFFSIFDPRFRRIPKEVVLPQLPPIQRIEKYVQMGEAQKKAYKEMTKFMVTLDSAREMIIAKNPIAKLTRLVQFASACAEVEGEEVRLSEPSCKLDALMEDLDDYLAAVESVVVFAQSRQLIEMASRRLQGAGIAHSLIKGGQTSRARQTAIDDFQAGEVPVILVVIAAGGLGITLTRARIGIFLQRSFSQVDMLQAEGRIHRIGSEGHKSVIYVNYVSKGTVEEKQLLILEGKAGKLEDIVRDRTIVMKLLGRGE